MHWFPIDAATPEHPAPTVLMGPGWSLPGDTNVNAVGLLGALSIKSLRDGGFNVLTWDPRGFGQSTGTAEVDSVEYEGRDVQQLLDWVASRPGVQLDAPGDPRVGMIGASYGGGIQFITAAIDCRVEAIVPVIAWHSLQSSLYKSDTVKSGWSGILVSVTKSRPVDAHAAHAYASGQATGGLDAEDRQWFLDRGPGDLVGKITAPTLLVQGTVDTLFTLDEAVTNYEILEKNGVPVSMLWFCGGHGMCLTDQGDPQSTEKGALAWLTRYVKGDTSTDTGARFNFLDQNGARYKVDDYPLPQGTPITATGSGTLELRPGGGSGPAQPPAGGGDVMASLVTPITPAKASNAVEVRVDVGSAAVIVGPPQLELTYSGTSPAGEKPTRVFAQLVDDATGLVLGNQVTPIPVTLDGQRHTTSIPLEIVAFAARPGARVTLQLVASTVSYAEPRLGGSVDFGNISLSLPTAAGLTPATR